MTCHLGGIPNIQDEICDITATMLLEICHNVAIEPTLQPLTTESFAPRSAHTNLNTCLNIQDRGYGTMARMHF